MSEKRMEHVAPWPDEFGDKLPVNEIFYSVQGEGRWAGHPAVFIRFKYCNLGCAWCDTRFTWDPSKIEPGELMTHEAIAERASELVTSRGIKSENVHTVLTGGEPMLHSEQLPGLIDQLRSHGFDFVEVETNGMYTPTDELKRVVSWWNCSPKLTNNGLTTEQNFVREAIWSIAATGQADFKFVVMKPEDIEEIRDTYLTILPPESIILMPEGITARKQLERMPWVMEACVEHGFRFGPRLHVLAFDNERKR